MKPFPLPQQHVHIWLVDPTIVTDSRLLDGYHQLMTPHEFAKWEKYVFDKDKHQHLVTRALIRETLSRYEPSIRPDQWRFNISSHGKPEIDNALSEPLFFNLSHTQNLAAVAVTRASTVGVDVEKIKNVEHVRGLAERCFTETENEYIFRDGKDSVLWRFFKLWTLKEAYLKARGCGMSLSLQSLSLAPEKQPLEVSFDESHDDDATAWQFRIWQAGQEHLLSLAINQPRHQTVEVKLFRCVPFSTFAPVTYEEIIGR